MSDPRPGDVLRGRFRLEEEIGKGGMGVVFRALDLELDEPVAVKVLAHHVDESARQRFRREVTLTRSIRHPNVCRMYDLHETEDFLFLTMEYVDGSDLMGWRKRAPIAPEKILPIVEQVAQGLAAAHDLDIVHRDIKPGNILVSGDRAVITDFGIARTLADPRTHATGAMVGSPYYMSPEQVTDATIGPAADIFSLGVVLYEILTGKNPFGREDPLASALRRAHLPAPPPSEHVPVPPTLDQLVQAMLRHAPEERPSARVLASRCRHLLENRFVTPSKPPPPTEPTLAVLPFQGGSDEESMIGEAIAEEVIDLLSKTRGMRVFTFSVTRGLGPQPTFEELRALGTDAVVQGAVRMDGDRVALDVEVIGPWEDSIWSGELDAPVGDLFEVEARVARRAAETLRLEMVHHQVRDRLRVQPKAMSLYLAGRDLLRRRRLDVGDAIVLLDAAVELEPDCPPFVAAKAIAHARLATFTDSLSDPAARLEVAQAALERAREVAPEMAETLLAEARLAGVRGDLGGEVRSLHRALELAPTSALAHARLGELHLFSGHLDEGRTLLERTLDLDPSENAARIRLARVAAFEGDEALARRRMIEATEAEGEHSTNVITETLRVKHYLGQTDHVAGLRGRLRDEPVHQLLRAVMSYLLGEADGSVLGVVHRRLEEESVWLRTTAGMILAEACMVRREPQRALAIIEGMASVLHDVDWLTRCPLLAELQPELRPIERSMRGRIDRIWRATL